MKGKNLEIFNEGIANGIIVPDRGLTLPGQGHDRALVHGDEPVPRRHQRRRRTHR